MAPRCDQTAYAEQARAGFERVVSQQAPAVRDAAQLIAGRLLDGGVLQAFGTGHSRSVAMEAVGRAGGLVPTNLIVLGDLVRLGGWDPARLEDPRVERDEGLAEHLLVVHNVDPRDVMLIASHSGANGSTVDMALLARGRGIPVVAVTSIEHSRQVPVRHPGGRRLYELADVVLDTGAPYGDAVLETGNGRVCGLSTLLGVLLVQMTVAEVVGLVQERGGDIPVYRSMNVPGSDDGNLAAQQRYEGRLRFIEA